MLQGQRSRQRGGDDLWLNYFSTIGLFLYWLIECSQLHLPLDTRPHDNGQWVDGICGSGQSGTVKNEGVENAGVDISARCGKSGHCRRKQEAQLLLGDRATRKHAKDC